MDLKTKHIPVLLDESIKFIDPKPGKFIIDGTIDGGGHAKEIIKRISPNGIFLGIDLDASMVKKTEKEIMEKLEKEKMNKLKTIFVHGNYADAPEIMASNDLPKADGLILDLGFGTEEVEESGRGFSFLKDEPIDMRYDADSGSQSAGEVVNGMKEYELADIFWKYGEERYSRRIARAIIEARRAKKITRTSQLTEIIRRAVPKVYERGRIHPATRVFQALRIFINKELENLEKVLSGLHKILKPKGRAVIISFHSLEDRIVKNVFREFMKRDLVLVLTKKPIRPNENEIMKNPKSRSAKLRAIELL